MRRSPIFHLAFHLRVMSHPAWWLPHPYSTAWLVVGGAWVGPSFFRKPTTFGISFGLTTITLAWVAGHLRIPDRLAAARPAGGGQHR